MVKSCWRLNSAYDCMVLHCRELSLSPLCYLDFERDTENTKPSSSFKLFKFETKIISVKDHYFLELKIFSGKGMCFSPLE